MSTFNYEDFLKISDEIELNNITSNLDMILILNERNIQHYDAETSFNKTMELMAIVSDLQDLKNKAVVHNSHSVADMCEVYIIEAEHQMCQLRKIYMNKEIF